MRRVILTLVFLSILVGLSGCNGTTPVKGNTFVGGTKGLEITFLQDSPPEEAFDAGQRPFDVSVQLRNVGEYDIVKERVKAKLSGLSPSDFSVPPEEFIKIAEEDLYKTTKDPEGNELEGTVSIITFNNLNYVERLSGPTVFPIRVDVCYKYGTIVESKLCVKENLLNTREKAVCTVTEDKIVENSGAPVQVTSFKEFAKAKDRIGFTFKIEHVGKEGSVYKRETDCNAGTVSMIDENKVWVRVEKPSDVTCSGLMGGSGNEGYVVMFKGTESSTTLSRTVTCNYDLPPTTTAYESLVRINLEYDYKEFVSKEIIIKHG